MRRVEVSPRRHWQKTVASQGLTYHTPDGAPYWDESVYYGFRMEEVDKLEAATNELHGMCLEAAANVIEKKRYEEIGIRADWGSLIERSWNEEPPAIYGRFDLWYDGEGKPKMLEYNADTPTSLLEAAVIQWFWMKDVFPGADQWNSIHERLVAKWAELRQFLPSSLVHFAHMDTREDFMAVSYLADTAREAGLRWHLIKMEDIGVVAGGGLVDDERRPMQSIFKLYPWEWLLRDEFAKHIDLGAQSWIEPAWKMVLSSKGILAVLWEMYPNHPYLLPAFIGSPGKMDAWARKPMLSREGANVTLSVQVNDEAVSIDATKGLYGKEGYVYQELCQLPDFDGKHPVIGSWVIDGVASGMGIREDNGLITGNLSRFVPHAIEEP